MGKRPVEEVVDGNQAYLKRQKISNTVSAGPADEINSGRELRKLLAFDQDAARSKHGGSSCQHIRVV
jgi:nucleolar pre-ribosomal-associated protein 1